MPPSKTMEKLKQKYNVEIQKPSRTSGGHYSAFKHDGLDFEIISKVKNIKDLESEIKKNVRS